LRHRVETLAPPTYSTELDSALLGEALAQTRPAFYEYLAMHDLRMKALADLAPFCHAPRRWACRGDSSTRARIATIPTYWLSPHAPRARTSTQSAMSRLASELPISRRARVSPLDGYRNASAAFFFQPEEHTRVTGSPVFASYGRMNAVAWSSESMTRSGGPLTRKGGSIVKSDGSERRAAACMGPKSASLVRPEGPRKFYEKFKGPYLR